MIFDGQLEPNTIIIKLPRYLKSKFTVQYEAIGLTAGDAAEESLNFISETVQKYIPAGNPCIIIDEDNETWSGITIPIGQK
jgi:hypothetical protein